MTSKRRSLLSRKSVKLSIDSVAYITRFKKKTESFGRWVEIAVSEKYWNEVKKWESDKIMKITDKFLYIENEKLVKDLIYYKDRLVKVEESYSKSMRELEKFKNSLS